MITIVLEDSTELVNVNIDNPGTDVICPIRNPGAYKVCLITLIYESLSNSNFNLAKKGIDCLIKFQELNDLLDISNQSITELSLKNFAILARDLKTISNISDDYS